MGSFQNSQYLEPLSGPPKRADFCVYDIESKAGPTQRPGFTRPFLVGYFEGKDFKWWRDTTPLKWKKRPCRWCSKKIQGYDEARLCASTLPESKNKDGTSKPCELENWEEFHLEARRGCMDKFYRSFFVVKNNGKVLYAHNGGGFDHLFLLPWLTRHRKAGYDFVIIPTASSIQKIEVTRILKDGTKLKFIVLDSMKLLPYGLDKAAKTFLPDGGKKEMDLSTEENDKLWVKYLKVDCEQLYKVMEKVHDLTENRLGGEVGITAPSTAMKLFRRKYLKKSLHRHPHFKDCQYHSTCNDCCHTWIRRGYYGGRTEIFEMFGEALKYYDLNSSYASAMLLPQPVYERYEQKLGTSIDWRQRNENVGFAEVTVSIREDCYTPPLPYRSEAGKLIFPVGEFGGVWDVDELALLDRDFETGKETNIESRRIGRITSTTRVIWFKQAPVFKEFVEDLWALRDKTRPGYDEGLSELAKLLINALYGKFAMDPNKEEIVFARASLRSKKPKEAAIAGVSKDVWECFLCGKDSDTKLGVCCQGSKAAGDADSDVWYKAHHVSASYIIPQIAAHITTIARINLWNYMMSASSKSLVVVKDGEREITRKTVRSAKAARVEAAKWAKRGFDEVPTLALVQR